MFYFVNEPPIFKKSNKGFTLIELSVVVGIVVFLTLIATISWKNVQGNLALQRSAIKVSQDVRKPLDLALAGKGFSCSAPKKISGYGIYFESASPASYFIFANCDDPAAPNQVYDPGDGIVQTISLENGIIVSQVSPQNPLSVVFIPPDPAVWINGGQTQETITIALQSNPSQTKSIVINSKGVATVQ